MLVIIIKQAINQAKTPVVHTNHIFVKLKTTYKIITLIYQILAANIIGYAYYLLIFSYGTNLSFYHEKAI